MKIVFSILLFFIASNFTFAQDPLFSQYYVNGLNINPALNAAKNKNVASTQYRSQWAGKNNHYTTYNAALELALNKSNSSLGFMLVNDETRNSLLHHNAFSIVYAYKFQIKRKWYIQTALQAGLGQNRLSNELIFEDQLNLDGANAQQSMETFSYENNVYPDFNAGFSLLSESYYFGAAIHHLNEANIAFSENYRHSLIRKYTVHGGAKFSKKKPGRIKTYYSPNFIIQIQGASKTLSIGNYFYHNGFTAGLWYRWGNALTAGVGYEFNHLRINYSADFSTSYHPSNALSHEISLAFDFRTNHNKRPKYNYITFCPSF